MYDTETYSLKKKQIADPYQSYKRRHTTSGIYSGGETDVAWQATGYRKLFHTIVRKIETVLMKGTFTMKKIMITVILFLMMLSVPVMAGYHRPFVPSVKKCIVRGCVSSVTENSPYCSYHKCSSKGCNSKCLSDGIYCATHQSKYNKNVRNSAGSWHGGSSTSSRHSSSGKSGNSGSGRKSESRRSSFDPDDHDIESYYDDYRDEYDDYDDAYDGFLDDDDAWDDY